ncbi:ABC transporter ATP-binding protein [Candidatus Woesearchaeota archaeon]|nr:ABC transporter ATP-binding protein [Candidatus Woesearchaeota archaeon]
MKKKLLEIKDLEAGYGKLQVLKGVNMHVNEGEIVAIIGPNGAGKSTVLKSIMSMVGKGRGSINFNNKNIKKLETHEIVKAGISMVPQGRIVFQSLTVEENLEMGGYLIKENNLIKQRIKEMYDFIPILRSKRKQRASFLSGGQQQMVSVARSLILRPKILLMDEPSLGLAPKTIQEVFEKIREIRDKLGITILMVEQNAHKALEICDRCYVLESGNVALEGTSKLTKDPRVKKLYLGGY